MRSSTKTAIITSLLVSASVGGMFAALAPKAGGVSAREVADLKHQIAALTGENRRLSDAVQDVQLMMKVAPMTEAPVQPAAPTPLTLTARTTAEPGQINDTASQAAATTDAFAARFNEQRRLLHLQTPQCKKPNEEGLIICEISMRNNDSQALLVSFSQSGSRVVLTPDTIFSSIRMRQIGQQRFNYTATATIPPQDARSIEIAFGPTTSAPASARSISLSVNNLTYEFADVALTN
jgi:hypothetical protein